MVLRSLFPRSVSQQTTFSSCSLLAYVASISGIQSLGSRLSLPRPLLPKSYSTTPMAPFLENDAAKASVATSLGDLNNTSSMRITAKPARDSAYAYRSLAIPPTADELKVRQRYRPFLLDEETQATDWVSRLELATVTKMAREDLERTGERLRVLVLYGSMRKRYAEGVGALSHWCANGVDRTRDCLPTRFRGFCSGSGATCEYSIHQASPSKTTCNPITQKYRSCEI
jgi:hypothetical protein